MSRPMSEGKGGVDDSEKAGADSDTDTEQYFDEAELDLPDPPGIYRLVKDSRFPEKQMRQLVAVQTFAKDVVLQEVFGSMPEEPSPLIRV